MTLYPISSLKQVMNIPTAPEEFNGQTIRFTTDGLQLSGTLHLPQVFRPPLVIGCHGLMSDSNSPKQLALARECNRYGLAFFRFDHRGCGASEGVFTEVTSLASRCNDLKRAVEVLRRRDDVGRALGFFGSSFGGAVCAAVAAQIAADALVTFAAPLHSDFMRSAHPTAAGPRFETHELDRRRLVFDIRPILKHVKNVLIIHGDADELVPVAHALAFHAAAGKPKELVLQAGGDHRMSDPTHQATFISRTVQWLRAGLLTNA
jgi:alpha-beta hydrolase superfamily lysophospholipase